MARSISRGYGLGSPLQNIFPEPIVSARAPTAGDTNYPLGQMWIDTNASTTYILNLLSGGAATWTLATAGASDVDSLTGDGGGAIVPTGGTIIVAGGTNLTTAGTVGPGTITFNLNDAITLVTSVTSPIYTTSAILDLNVRAAVGQNIILRMGDNAGANSVSFQDIDNVEVFSVDSNGGIPVIAGALTVNGLFTANASATINTAGTALNLATDNSGDAVTIAEGNVARAVTIATSAFAHTIALGSASGGAMTWDTAAGISIDAATASNFTVTGAADLTLESTAGAVLINSGEAAIDAIVLDASSASG
nr:hypothetical protein [Chlamydiota bacterium]